MDVNHNKWNLEFVRSYQHFEVYLSISCSLSAVKRDTIIPFRRIIDSSNFIRPKVIARKTFRTDSFSMRTLDIIILMSTLEIIIPQHSTMVWSNLICPLPFGVSSSSVKIIVLCPNLSHYVYEIFLYGSFRDMRLVYNLWKHPCDFLMITKIHNRNMCRQPFQLFNYWILTSLWSFRNLTVSSTPTLFFFKGSWVGI